jgi:hypothetical protein
MNNHDDDRMLCLRLDVDPQTLAKSQEMSSATNQFLVDLGEGKYLNMSRAGVLVQTVDEWIACLQRSMGADMTKVFRFMDPSFPRFDTIALPYVLERAIPTYSPFMTTIMEVMPITIATKHTVALYINFDSDFDGDCVSSPLDDKMSGVPWPLMDRRETFLHAIRERYSRFRNSQQLLK